MGLSTFIGGVHPYEGKELSADKPIQVIQPKGELVYPLSQHMFRIRYSKGNRTASGCERSNRTVHYR